MSAAPAPGARAAGTPAGTVAGGGTTTGPAALPDPPAAPGPRSRTGVLVAAVLLSVVSLAVALTALLVADRDADRAEQVRASALDAARERTLALTSYDYRDLDAATEQVLDAAVDPFRSEYASTVDQLRSTFAANQAVAESRVVAAGLEAVDVEAERATAVVAVDQVITQRDAAPRTERNRLRMVLVRPEGRWLVERVERL